MNEFLKSQEDEKKKKKLTEKQKQDEVLKQIKFKEKKEEIELKEQTQKLLSELKELVELGIISDKTAKKIELGEKIKEEEVKNLLNKIEELDNIKDIERYIPKDLLIKKDEYLKALNEKKTKEQVLWKLNNTLSIVAKNIWGSAWTSIWFFSTFLHILDKNLVLIQENSIDLKDYLENK